MLIADTISLVTDWKPFLVGEKADYVRPMANQGGVEDRLRTVAFAEVQARDAFLWGAKQFAEVPAEWRSDWERFAEVENRHAQMLLSRFSDLGFELGARRVSDKLHKLCLTAQDPIFFLFLLASAEERGMEAGFIVAKQMEPVDPISAKIFLQIAQEEEEHVASSQKILHGYDLDALRDRARQVHKSLGANI